MKTRLPLALLSCSVITVSAGFSPRACASDGPSAMMAARAPEKAAPANAAIMAYLGDPVPPPADLDPRYTADGLTAAFKTACAKLGFELRKLTVDDTEFPFLVYGVINGIHDLKAMPDVLRAVPGYAYGGSVAGRGDSRTFFSLNLMPSDQYPRAQQEAIQRRLMIRLQMLGAIASGSTQ